MTKICRYTSNANFSMSLLQRSLLLFATALLLLGGEVQCATVGLGKHTVDISNGIVNKVNDNFDLIKPEDDLTALKAFPDACDDVTYEGDRIKVWYKPNSKAAKEGCALDLLVTSTVADKFTLDFGAYHSVNLGKCLGGIDFPNENLLPFTYSLKEGEFEYLRKNGPKKGQEGWCQSPDVCKNHAGGDGKCMEFGDFMVGVADAGEFIINFIKQIDEPVGWYCSSFRYVKSNTDSFFQIDITVEEKKKWFTRKEDHRNCPNDKIGHGMDYNTEHKHTACFWMREDKNNLRKVGRWKINDENFKGKLNSFNYYTHLITFYMLPQKSAHQQKEMRDGPMNILKDEKLNGPNCDLYIRFPNTYRLLGPTSTSGGTESNTTTTTTTEAPAPHLALIWLSSSSLVSSFLSLWLWAFSFGSLSCARRML